MTLRIPLGSLGAVLFASALIGCGGGGGNDAGAAAAAVPDTVPPSAAASIGAFLDYQKSLGVDDTIEPLQLQQLLPPQSETTEPTPIG